MQKRFITLVDLLRKDEIPLENIVSSLSDSANYMRGNISRFETRLRNAVPYLLDIDGDICHHVHNVTRKFCSHFDGFIECLNDNLHSDFKWSPDLRQFLKELCLIMGCRFHVPPQRVSHRWLSMFDVTTTNKELFDVLTVFYFAWVDKDCKEAYFDLYKEKIKGLSKESRRRLFQITGELRKKKLTKEGMERKKRLVDKVFYKRDKTLLLVSFYLSVLPLFKSFVLTFESKEPSAHKFHDELYSVTTHFLCCFIKPEIMTSLSSKRLLKLDLKCNLHQLPLSQIYVDAETEKLLICLESSVVHSFLNVLLAYVDAGCYMQKKFPLQNSLFRHLSAVDPKAIGHSTTHGALKELRKYFPTFLKEEDQYLKEISKLQVDPNLPDTFTYPRLDLWWAQLFDRYPAIAKVIKAVLSIFTGPRIEQSFSVMNDIINPKSNRMLIDTFSAIQTVKYDLRARQKTSLELYKREDKFKSPIDTGMCYFMQTAHGRYQKKRKAETQKANDQKKRLKISQAKTLRSRKNIHKIATAQKRCIIARNRLAFRK